MEFQAQLRRIAAFVKHPTAIGTSHELILRRFLQKYTPGRFAVSEGFVVKGERGRSNQCDVIIWSHLEHSPYYRDGDLVVVPAEAVRAVIEVKTSLSGRELNSGFKNLDSVRRLSADIYTGIFAFETASLATVLRMLVEDIDVEYAEAVNSIYGMQGWCLQAQRGVPMEPEPAQLMETRPWKLKAVQGPVGLDELLPPAKEPIAHGLAAFLGFLFIGLGQTRPAMSFHVPLGLGCAGHVFPGRGIQVFKDVYSSALVLSGDRLAEHLSVVTRQLEEILASEE